MGIRCTNMEGERVLYPAPGSIGYNSDEHGEILGV
jgi:hypothetical protein